MTAWLKRSSFLIGLAFAIACGWIGADWLARGGRLRLEYAQPFLIGFIFLVSGLVLPGTALIQATVRLRVHAALQGFILLGVPLLAWGVAATGCFDAWPEGLRAGVLILACLPTTITSCVVLTRTAGGDEALALVAAASGSVVGVAVCPWTILALTGVRPEAPLLQVVTNLAVQTLLPLAVGQVLRLRWHVWFDHQRKELGQWSNRAFLVILAYVVATTISGGSVRLDAGILLRAGLAVGIGLPSLLLLAAGLARIPLLRLDRAGRIAVQICAAQKSAAIGIPVVGLLATGRDDIGLICLPIVLYHACQLVVGGILADRWGRGVGPGSADPENRRSAASS